MDIIHKGNGKKNNILPPGGSNELQWRSSKAGVSTIYFFAFKLVKLNRHHIVPLQKTRTPVIVIQHVKGDLIW